MQTAPMLEALGAVCYFYMKYMMSSNLMQNPVVEKSELALQLALEKLPINAIAAKLGCSRQWVRVLLQRAGYYKFSLSLKHKIIHLYVYDKKPLKWISRHTNVSIPKVKEVLLEAGISLRKPGRPALATKAVMYYSRYFQLHCAKGSKAKIAKEFGVSVSAVSQGINRAKAIA